MTVTITGPCLLYYNSVFLISEQLFHRDPSPIQSYQDDGMQFPQTSVVYFERAVPGIRRSERPQPSPTNLPAPTGFGKEWADHL